MDESQPTQLAGDGERPAVLDYGRPPVPRWLRAARWIYWFLLRRPLRHVELAIAGWLTATGGYYVAATTSGREPREEYFPLIVLLVLASAAAATLPLALIVIARRWRPVAIWALVALPAVAMSGMVQSERCPHARYVQIMGISIDVQGKRCHNIRDITPWWKRAPRMP